MQKKKYLLLFDAIYAQGKYDEKALAIELKNERFVKQLAVAKNYLYQLILRALELYSSSIETDIKSMLSQAEILFKKTLFVQCNSLLKKIKKRALKYEKYIFYYQALQLEKQIFINNSYTGVNESDLKRIYTETNKALKMLSDIDDYSLLLAKIFLLINRGGEIRSRSQASRFNKIIRSDLLSAKKFSSKTAEIIFHFIYTSFGTHTQSNPALITPHPLRVIEIYHNNPHFFDVNPHNYIVSINNLIRLLTQENKYGEAIGLIHRMRTMAHANSRINKPVEMLIFNLSYIQETDLYIHSGDFKTVSTIDEAVQAGLKKFAGKLDKISFEIICYNMAYLQMGNSNYKQSQYWLNKILNQPSDETRRDLLCYAKILSLIVCFEKEDTESLPYILKSTYRLLIKRRSLYKAESVFIKSIFLILRSKGDKDEIDKIFRMLKDELLLLMKDPIEKNSIGYFDFVSWLESKIENRNFAEIIQKKAQQNN